MKKLLLNLCVFTLLAGTQTVLAQTGYGEDRLGTDGFQFVNIPVDARSAAMGNSVMADAIDGSSLYWNPALSARLEGSNVMISHTELYVDMTMDYFSFIHNFKDFALGASVQYLNSGDIKETTEFQPFGTGRTFNTHHISLGLSGAHKVTDLFSYGVTFRLVQEKILEVDYFSPSLDFGFSYLVGETGLRFAVGLNNFGLDAEPSGSTEREGLNGIEDVIPEAEISSVTRFNIAAAYDLYEDDNNKVVVTTQLTNPSDNAEQVKIGAEYGFMNQFFVRGGYEFGHIERKWPSAGVGFDLPLGSVNLRADYSYTLYERLGDIHRIAISFSL